VSLVRVFLAADEEIRKVRIGVVVTHGGTIDARCMQARCERNCCRCAVIPFVLTASVHIDICDPENNGHGFRSGRTHLYELCVQFIGNGVGDKRCARSAHDEPWSLTFRTLWNNWRIRG
jgi:hypothetical protein